MQIREMISKVEENEHTTMRNKQNYFPNLEIGP